MGCVSSKVGQKPPEQTNLKDGGVASRAVESRPAQPVVESNEASKSPASKTRGKGKDGLKKQALLSERAWRMEGGEEEKEGETVTDASGLQMRTPRTCTDRGLQYAAKNGDLPLVHKLLGNSTDKSQSRPQEKPCSGRTASSAPVAADLDERGMWGNTPLIVATQYGHPHVALALIAGGANTCLENGRRATALHFSCAEGLLDVGRALLENGANVDPPVAAVHHPAVNGGQTVPVTPLSAAATGGHTELVRLLVERGAEVDRRVSPKGTDGQDRRTSFSGTDGVGGSALTAAARYGHMEISLLLIDSGASLLLEDWDARTPLLHAILGGHAHTSLALLDVARKTGCARKLAEPEDLGTWRANPSRSTPLHAACDTGLYKVVKALLAAGARVESRDATRATPLLCACRKGRLLCVQGLLARGANPMAEDRTGNTPLSAAHGRIEQSRGEDILRLIEAAIADPEPREDRPHPPLGKHDSQNQAEAEAEDDDDDEDVLLVSDWDENVEGVDVLDECDVADGSRRTDHNHDHQISANREQTGRGRHTVEAQPRKDPGGSIETEDEEDVLLVGDYDPDTEEEAGLVEILSPVTSPRRATGSPEVRSFSADSLLQVQKDLASSGTAQSIDNTYEEVNVNAKDRGLRSGVPRNGKNGSENDAAFEGRNLPQGSLPPIAPRGGAYHGLKPEDLTAKLSTLQVAADSVDMVLATAADRIVVGQDQPEGEGGG